MDELTLRILTSRSIPDLIDNLGAAASAVAGAVKSTIVLLSPSGGEIEVAASTDEASVPGDVLFIGSIPEFQEAVHERRAVALPGGLVPGTDVAAMNRNMSWPDTNLIVPAMAGSRIAGILMLKMPCVDGGIDPSRTDVMEIASASGHALIAINAERSLGTDLRRWQEDCATLMGELERNDLYTELFRYNPDGMVLIDHHGTILAANPTAESVLRPDGGPLPENLEDLVEEADRRTWLDLLQGFEQGIFPHHVDLTVDQGTGEAAIISLSISLVPRRTEVILLTLRNVSVDRHIEHRLGETKAFLEKIISSSMDAIIAADMTGNIVLFNETASRLWGIPQEEALSGLHVTDLYGPGQASEIMKKLRSEEFGGVGRMEPQRIWLMSRSGENIPVILAAYVIYEEGKEAYSIGVFSDLREKLRAEEKIAVIEDRLAQSEKQVELAELAGAMAHELNQPLTSIYGSTEILIRKLEDDARALRYAKIIQDEAQRMGDIIKKIGRMTRFETQSYVGSAKIADLGRSAVEPGDEDKGSDGR